MRKGRRVTTPLAEKSAKTPELSSTHSPLGTHGLWGDKNAQLPAYVQNIAKAMMRNGHDESSAIAMAVGAVKRWARGGGKVSPEVRAAAGKAVAEWEKLKAEHSKSKGAEEPDIEKFRLPHFNPAELRDAHGRWSRQSQERKLQSALRESSLRDEPKVSRAERKRIASVARRPSRERGAEVTSAAVPYRSSTGTPSKLHGRSPVKHESLQVRANAGEDKKAPAYLRSDIHVLSSSQKYTDEQVQQLQRQLDELKSEIRKETHKDTRFMNALQFGSVLGAIGMELLSLHTGGFGLVHGGEGEAASTGLAVIAGLTLKELPHLVEPIIDYAHHLKGHKGKVVGKPTPYAKKADDAVAAQVASLIAAGLQNGGVDRDDAQRFAAIVTNAAAEARDAGRREYERGFISDDQARRMLSQFGG